MPGVRSSSNCSIGRRRLEKKDWPPCGKSRSIWTCVWEADRYSVRGRERKEVRAAAALDVHDLDVLADRNPKARAGPRVHTDLAHVLQGLRPCRVAHSPPRVARLGRSVGVLLGQR